MRLQPTTPHSDALSDQHSAHRLRLQIDFLHSVLHPLHSSTRLPPGRERRQPTWSDCRGELDTSRQRDYSSFRPVLFVYFIAYGKDSQKILARRKTQETPEVAAIKSEKAKHNFINIKRKQIIGADAKRRVVKGKTRAVRRLCESETMEDNRQPCRQPLNSPPTLCCPNGPIDAS